MIPFKASIYKSDGVFFEGELESLVVPTTDGMYGVLAHHRNVVVAIVPGEMHYNRPGEETVYARITEGMLRVWEGEVLILCDSAEYPDELAAKRERERDEEIREAALQQRSVQEYLEAEMMLQRAVSGLRKRDYHHS